MSRPRRSPELHVKSGGGFGMEERLTVKSRVRWSEREAVMLPTR
jgi:hypothetical protein